MISYSSPDGRQVETVRVALAGLALRATGYIVSAGEHPYGASYSVVVDNEGRSRRMTVRSDDVDGERSLSLTRSPGGPWVAETATGSAPQPDLDDAVDIYLVGSAFTASLPIRRLGLGREAGASAEVTVASISLPGLVVTPVLHRGRNESADTDGARIAYSGPFGDRELLVDGDELFVSSEGLMARLG
jgi:hypothetical protein